MSFASGLLGCGFVGLVLFASSIPHLPYIPIKKELEHRLKMQQENKYWENRMSELRALRRDTNTN